jgi:nucleoside-diphosphate-sugar epimerase
LHKLCGLFPAIRGGFLNMLFPPHNVRLPMNGLVTSGTGAIGGVRVKILENDTKSSEPVIITGANGFIGSYLALLLLKRGWTVHALGRGRDSVPWQERVLASLKSADPAAGSMSMLHLHTCEADLAQPDLGISDVLARFERNKFVLVHLAGDTRFIPPDAAAQRQVNVEGTLNVVRALRPALSRMVHVSTAYVAGNRTGTILEDDTDVGQSFHNNYERTKLDAEVAVHQVCSELDLPLAIARPSIIVNDTVHGRSSAMTHLNVLVEAANRIQEFYGIRDGEVVNPEIRVLADAAARPNIAPVDPIAEALARIVESPGAAGRTYHLCHPSPQTNAEIFSLVLQAFGIHDKIRLRFVQELEKPLTRTEDMVLRAFRVYLPYLKDAAKFDCAHTRELIPHYDRMFGPASVDYLQRVIAFERTERRRWIKGDGTRQS